ncbi:MAG TPA: flagellar biosynthesis protein FlhF [Chloroflexota bacterium]|nr:flagellar biosynthesis protein FlhF [Chloroflexota bacterium]
MKMKRYTAGSMADALAAIRTELGPRAIIVHSTTTRKGPLGLLQRPMVEVVAAVDESARPRPKVAAAGARLPRPTQTRPHPAPLPKGDESRAVLSHATSADLLRAIAQGTEPVAPAAIREMQHHVKELRGAIARMVQHAQWPGMAKLAPPLADLYQRLLGQEVEPALAQELVTAIDSELSLQASGDRATVLECLAKHLRRRFPTTGPLAPKPGQPTVLFLVGPTGVGKTTTIAKLAATLTLQRQAVALVTCDTYRIAAIPQLRTYADILRVPIEVAYSPDELTAKVMDHVERDFIIVDTPGRSQRNGDQLAELRCFVTAVPAQRTFLTVAAGARYRDMLDVVARFGTVPFDGLLVTKLDETTTFGPLLNLAAATAKPISYLTNGQNVPRDITLATPHGLTEMLIEAAYADAAPADQVVVGSVAAV